MCLLPIYSFYTEVFCSFVLINGFFSFRTQNSVYAYHLHFCWRTAYQGSAYRIPSKKVGIRRTKKGGYSLRHCLALIRSRAMIMIKVHEYFLLINNKYTSYLIKFPFKRKACQVYEGGCCRQVSTFVSLVEW